MTKSHEDALTILGVHMDQGAIKGDDTPWTMTAAHRRDLIQAVSKLTEIVRKVAKKEPVFYYKLAMECVYCGLEDAHKDDCLWVQARTLIDFLDGGDVS